MKNKITVFLIALMALSLTACTGKNGTKEGTVTEAIATSEAVSTQETETMQEEVKIEMEKSVIEGMVVDAAMSSLTIQTKEGEVQFFAYPDEGLTSAKEDGILLGDVVKVTYAGSVENGDAVAESVEAGSIETALPREAYEFALRAVSCAKFNDLEGLSQLAAYPVYVGIDENTSAEIKDEAGFTELDREALMPLGALADYNLFDMTESKAGIVIGDTKPNIIFTKIDDGYAITGINVE